MTIEKIIEFENNLHIKLLGQEKSEILFYQRKKIKFKLLHPKELKESMTFRYALNRFLKFNIFTN
jgi:hypothetical protein